MVIIVFATSGATSNEDTFHQIKGVSLGQAISTLPAINENMISNKAYGPLQVKKWQYTNGNELSVSLLDGAVSYIEYDWSLAEHSKETIFGHFTFGVTNLTYIRKYFGSNGVFFRERDPFATLNDIVLTFNTYPIADGYVSFVTGITPLSAKTIDRKDPDATGNHLTLHGIILVSKYYANQFWGVELKDPRLEEFTHDPDFNRK